MRKHNPVKAVMKSRTRNRTANEGRDPLKDHQFKMRVAGSDTKMQKRVHRETLKGLRSMRKMKMSGQDDCMTGKKHGKPGGKCGYGC